MDLSAALSADTGVDTAIHGSATQGGEPDNGPAEPSGEPSDAVAPAKSEPSGEGLFDGMTPENLHKSYKSLQSEYTKTKEAMKGIQTSLDAYGGVENISKWAEYLSSNPRFAEWVEAERKAQLFGVKNPTNVSDEEKRAMEIVQRIADERIQAAMREKVEPIANQYKDKMLAETFVSMDRKYPDWREMREVMSEIGAALPREIQDNPTLDNIEDLYWKALRQSGKIEQVMTKMYENNLRQKKSAATIKPTATAGAATMPAPKTIKEAFEQAKLALAAQS